MPKNSKSKKKTAKTTKAAKTTKQKPAKMKQTHGKIELRPETSLHHILGQDGYGFYNTSDAKVYENYVRTLHPDMLEKHATEAGVIPVDNRELLVDGLVNKFYRHWAKYDPNEPAPDSIPGHTTTLHDIIEKGYQK